MGPLIQKLRTMSYVMFNLVLKTDRPKCRNDLPSLKTSHHQYSHVILNIPVLSYDRLLIFQSTF